MTDDRQGQDDERISAIRAAHYPWSPYGDDPFCPKCLDDNNESSWPCDYGYVLTRLDALAAERDRAVELRAGDQHWARHFKAKADDLLARLAAAEAALRASQGIIHEGLHGGRPTVPEHQERCEKPACRRIRAALAGSRERAQGEGE